MLTETRTQGTEAPDRQTRDNTYDQLTAGAAAPDEERGRAGSEREVDPPDGDVETLGASQAPEPCEEVGCYGVTPSVSFHITPATRYVFGGSNIPATLELQSR